MRPMIEQRLLGLFALAALASACASSDEGLASGGAKVADPGAATAGPAGVSQAGAQDFGLFRQILDDGGIPAPSTLDDLGFFGEHKLDYPQPTCGQNLCMHSLLGVMGNMITGSTCTLIQIGMNTPVDPTKVERPPLNLVLAIDVSGSMAGDPMAYVKEGLKRMLDHLEPGDRVSIVAYADAAEVLADQVPSEQKATLEDHFVSLTAGGKTNLFDGLYKAFELAAAHQEAGWQNRVLFLSDGQATTGIDNVAKLRSLAEGYARLGIGITTIGVGKDFDVEVMRTIAEVGAGNFYFLEDPSAMLEVFTEEVKTFMFPLAVNVRIEVGIGDAYLLGDAYGTNGWTRSIGGGVIEIPSLFIAGRTDSKEPIDGGRRGGGGAIIVELLPKHDLGGIAAPDFVGGLKLTWTDPATGEVHTEEKAITYPHTAGEYPEGGYFTDATVEKGFVMLNLFAGFQMATELAADADPGNAIGVLKVLELTVASWLKGSPDPDIQDDLDYVRRFIQNLEAAQNQTPVSTPPEPWPMD